MTALVAHAGPPGDLAHREIGTRHSPLGLLESAGGLDAPSTAAVELVTIARSLAPRADSWPGMRRPTRRTWDLMATTDGFEAWVIAWPPGGAIELHDHGTSAGAVIVVRGALFETTVVEHPDGRLDTDIGVLRAGTAISFESSRVHDLVNVGIAPAISVHVYSPRLSAMTFYEITGNHLVAGRTDHFRCGRAVP